MPTEGFCLQRGELCQRKGTERDMHAAVALWVMRLD